MVEYSSDLPCVKCSDQNIALCSEPGAEFIKECIEEHDLNRVIVAACTPLTHQPVFHAVLEEANLPSRMLEFSNLREQVSFVHAEDKEKSLDQAKDIIRGAVGRAQLLEAVPRKVVDVIPKCAIIGGGIAGMTAALELADKGFKVYLIEKTPSLGGNMAKLDRIFPTDECCI